MIRPVPRIWATRYPPAQPKPQVFPPRSQELSGLLYLAGLAS